LEPYDRNLYYVLNQITSLLRNCVGVVIVSVLASSVVDNGFKKIF